ncbi:MAG: porin family protein [Rhizobiales bacterium]|nr:porin family protein [Hyphomicrobiales bacterium]
MRSVKYLIAAGAASLISTAALAADMPSIMPPPPPLYVPPPCCEDFGGWYLRGDIGMSNQSVKSLYNVLNNAPGTRVNPIFYDFDSAMTFGGGVGYQFNSWFRVDGTVEYRGKSNFHGLEIISNGGAVIGTDEYHASKSEWLVLANAYADLGTWWCVTPFIGVGVGTSRNTISNFTDINTPNAGVAYGLNSSQWQFAYAAYAGLSYKVNNSFTVELAYRYLNMGDGISGDLQTFTGINAVYNPTTFKTLTSQDVRLGVRWSLQPTPAPVYAPPLIRKG